MIEICSLPAAVLNWYDGINTTSRTVVKEEVEMDGVDVVLLVT